MNWLRNTVGVLPFIWFGREWFGLDGVVLGPAVGGVLFGLVGFALALHLVKLKERQYAHDWQKTETIFISTTVTFCGI